MKNIEKLRNEIINQELCSGCGACMGVCPVDVIRKENSYSYHPDTFDINGCIDCGLCLYVCPGPGYDIYNECEEGMIFNKDIGYYKNFYSGFSLDENLKKSASAGGAATEILKYLIEHDIADKVSIVKNTEELGQGLIYSKFTNDIAEIFSARQSKYCQASIDKLLKEMTNTDEKFAVIALPCQLAALRKAEEKIKGLKEKIVFKIGLFCGYVYTPACVNGLFSYMGIKAEDVKKIIGWREGGIPGNFAVRLKDGGIKQIPFAEEHSIDVSFYSLLRCHLCADWSGVYADLSLGDIGGWQRKDIIISRTNKAEKLLGDMKQIGKLSLEKLDKKVVWETTTMPFMNNAKKERSQLFIDYLKKRKKSVPIWNLQYHNKTFCIRLYSKIYFNKLTKAREKLAFYERDPRLIIKKGKYLYLKFWKNLLFQSIRKIEKIVFKRGEYL